MCNSHMYSQIFFFFFKETSNYIIRWFITRKEKKHEKDISAYICYSIVQKADTVYNSTNNYPPKVYTLFEKKNHRGDGEERTEVLNSERKKQ